MTNFSVESVPYSERGRVATLSNKSSTQNACHDVVYTRKHTLFLIASMLHAQNMYSSSFRSLYVKRNSWQSGSRSWVDSH